ncbi:DUF7000 family protein [Acetanaerobacterium elongatum]|uniref:DUF7000 domain-containing protein n=1 Tax=Acetanaerobacterium elongatum TaxID=258515 RepID=A0A1H0EED1_9FIRM|nr:hypothetical protein [Acetanaerobacterium elongatum]SDN80646.1 hypothetical protein SAMN05192585_1332 [Acetanaerobacterium elongatum]
MKPLNKIIGDYTCHLQQGEIQTAYKGILELIGKLRANFIYNYPRYVIGGIYQGYMEMTYFSLSTNPLRDEGIKFAIVYLHQKGAFEVWLSARNRDIAEKYESVLSSNSIDNSTVHHDNSNPNAIIKCTLTSTPDFEDPDSLIFTIEQGVEKFITTITNLFDARA